MNASNHKSFSSVIKDEYKKGLTEDTWRRAHANQLRRERSTLIKKGIITPAESIKPQLMVKIDGQWLPELKTYE